MASRKHSFFFKLTSPNLRTKITRVPCRRRNEGSFPRAEKFGDLMAVDHKVFNEEVNLETITDTQSRYKISPLSGFNRIRTKQSRHRRRRRVSESFSSRRKSRKSFTPTIHWNLAKPVKNGHGIIELLHFIDPRRIVLLQERCAELTKELLQAGLDEKCWADSMEWYCSLRNVQHLPAGGQFL